MKPSGPFSPSRKAPLLEPAIAAVVATAFLGLFGFLLSTRGYGNYGYGIFIAMPINDERNGRRTLTLDDYRHR